MKEKLYLKFGAINGTSFNPGGKMDVLFERYMFEGTNWHFNEPYRPNRANGMQRSIILTMIGELGIKCVYLDCEGEWVDKQTALNHVLEYMHK